MKDYYTMSYRIISKSEFTMTIMTPINVKERKQLDDVGGLTIERGGFKFVITPKDIIGYGKIDFTEGSDDMWYLSQQKFLDHYVERGICVPARYNYEEHCCYSKTRKPEYFDTTRPEVLCKYVHGMLGKPELCLIFKYKNGISIN